MVTEGIGEFPNLVGVSTMPQEGLKYGVAGRGVGPQGIEKPLQRYQDLWRTAGTVSLSQSLRREGCLHLCTAPFKRVASGRRQRGPRDAMHFVCALQPCTADMRLIACAGREHTCTERGGPLCSRPCAQCVYLYSEEALTLCLLPYSRQKLQDAWPIWLCIISQPFYDEVEQVEDLEAKPCRDPSEMWELLCIEIPPQHAMRTAPQRSHRSACSRSVLQIDVQWQAARSAVAETHTECSSWQATVADL